MKTIDANVNITEKWHLICLCVKMTCIRKQQTPEHLLHKSICFHLGFFCEYVASKVLQQKYLQKIW